METQVLCKTVMDSVGCTEITNANMMGAPACVQVTLLLEEHLWVQQVLRWWQHPWLHCGDWRLLANEYLLEY